MLRERFVITEKSAGASAPKDPVIAMGNRIVVSLKESKGEIIEHMIVRGHNMHCVARMAARLYMDFLKKGAILSRMPTYDWDGVWANVCSTYETLYNPQNWIAVYYKGRPVFKHGSHHPFLDVMEQCDANNRDEYDKAVSIAENIFLQAGKAVKIEKDTNIAAVISVADTKARCGLIMRGAKRPSTFSISLDSTTATATIKKPEAHMCLNMSAAFLEAIQLAFVAGQIKAKTAVFGLTKASDEARQAEHARKRIGRLNAEIKSYENMFNVRYRPERPDLFHIIDEAYTMFVEIYKESKKKK
jgi:dsDNA-binding SOS-regulon protein